MTDKPTSLFERLSAVAKNLDGNRTVCEGNTVISPLMDDEAARAFAHKQQEPMPMPDRFWVRMSDNGQHIRKWATGPFEGGVEFARADYTRRRVHELMGEGDGCWVACSGCQESVDGSVSAKDYPYDRTFKVQPGSGCRECGGIGVIWDTTDYQAYAREVLAAECPGPDFEPAWREMHDKLSWMQGNKALPAEYLGRNFADIANDLIDRAYPGLREGKA